MKLCEVIDSPFLEDSPPNTRKTRKMKRRTLRDLVTTLNPPTAKIIDKMLGQMSTAELKATFKKRMGRGVE